MSAAKDRWLSLAVKNVVNVFDHMLVMGAFPVDLFALAALIEGIVVFKGVFPELILHRALAHSHDFSVAFQTAVEQLYLVFQVESPDDFPNLLLWLIGA